MPLQGAQYGLFPRSGCSWAPWPLKVDTWPEKALKWQCQQEAHGFLLSIRSRLALLGLMGHMSCLLVGRTENGHRISHCLPRAQSPGPVSCTAGSRGGLDRVGQGMGNLGTTHGAGPGFVPPPPVISQDLYQPPPAGAPTGWSPRS